MRYEYSVYKRRINYQTIYIAESKELVGCTGSGATYDEAVRDLEKKEKEFLESAKDWGFRYDK